MWKRFGNIIIGFLGTLTVHLLIAVIFMLFKLNALYKEKDSLLIFDFEEEEILSGAETEEMEIPAEIASQFEEEITNIARNLALETDPEVSREDYMEQLKKEMESAGQLEDNNILDQLNKEEVQEAGETALQQQEEAPPDTLIFKSEEMAARYEGATRIYYELPNRVHRRLPLPVYKCPLGGKVVLYFIVSPAGEVLKAEVNEAESNTQDPCLLQAAREAITASRFNPVSRDQENQTGKITYFFVDQ